MIRLALPVAFALVFAVPVLAQSRIAVDVAEASAAVDDQAGRPFVMVQMAADDAEAFAAFTTRHVGHTIELLVDGVVVSAPMLQTPITSDRLQIHGVETFEAAQALADRLNAAGATVDMRLRKSK